MADRGRRVEANCDHCGIVFHPRAADRKRGWGRFCSKRCKAKHQERRTHQFVRHLERQMDDVDPGDDMYWERK